MEVSIFGETVEKREAYIWLVNNAKVCGQPFLCSGCLGMGVADSPPAGPTQTKPLTLPEPTPSLFVPPSPL